MKYMWHISHKQIVSHMSSEMVTTSSVQNEDICLRISALIFMVIPLMKVLTIIMMIVTFE